MCISKLMAALRPALPRAVSHGNPLELAASLGALNTAFSSAKALLVPPSPPLGDCSID